MPRLSWDGYYIKQLPQISARSHDKHTKTGCIITGADHEILSTGYNGLPRRMDADAHPERLERPEKYHWMVHAEANSIANAARNGVALKGGTAYMSFLPCGDCARLIVQSGIVRVVVDKANHDDILTRSDKYVEEFKRTTVLFSELGIELVWWEEGDTILKQTQAALDALCEEILSNG